MTKRKPRGKGKIQGRLTINDIYDKYTTEEKLIKDSPYDVDKQLFRGILERFFQELMDYMIDDGGEFRLPFRLGRIGVFKKRIEYKFQNQLQHVDWYSTLQLGKCVYHFNEHTDGFKYFFSWNREIVGIPNVQSYRFIPTRANKRILAKKIKQEGNDYMEFKKNKYV